jgi:peptidoglycan/LPS O-acetylase OafA/YrhL
MMVTNQTNPPINPTRVEALDLLRLLAALAVVAYHFGFHGPDVRNILDAALPQMAFVAKYGYLGVPLFFVISGFVIAYSASGRNALDFAIARIARIYPGFIFCMTLTFLVTFAFGAPYLQVTISQWMANLLVFAPTLKQPYVDNVYWTIAVELTFYAWVCVLMAIGVFARRIGTIVLVWLTLSLVNEVFIGSYVIEKVLLTNQSGFFAAGLLLYEIYRGRRDAAVQILLGISAATALVQSLLGAQELRARYGVEFDAWIVASLAMAAIILVAAVMRIRRLPLWPGAMIGIGGLTYPLYLLHQDLGYVIYNRMPHAEHSALAVTCIVLGIIGLSWAVWRFIERPLQRLTKNVLAKVAVMLGGEPAITSRPQTSN